MKNRARHSAICAIFAREQVCRKRMHAGIHFGVKTLMSGLSNRCDLTLTTWGVECHI